MTTAGDVTVVEHEPQWLPEDLVDVLAWQRWSDGLCECGHPKDESMAAGADNAYTGKPVQCHACRAAQRAVDGWSADELRGIYLTSHRDD